VSETSPRRDFRALHGGAFRLYGNSMHRRTAILAPLALLALGLPARAEPIPLKDLSKYLNSLTSAKSDFTQVNADGTISTGTLYIRRPGRVRFEYAPPDRTLVLASAGNVAIFDPKSNQPPEQYPLKRTPLNLILAETVDLGRAKMVVGHREDGNTTRVRAQDPENPEYGSIELVFTADPVALRQWVIRDDQGGETTVILGELVAGGNFPTSLFSITREVEKRSN
jgi:outer membrane lipoprotein-sorting protein